MPHKPISAVALACCSLLLPAVAPAQEGLKLSTTLSQPVAQEAQAPPADLPAAQPGPYAPGAVQLPALAMRGVRVPEYRIGTEDLIEVQVFGVDQLTRTVRVDARGTVSLPLIGLLEVAGLTVQETQALVTARLAESYLQDPQVSVFIKEFTTQRVTVEGAVNRPGIYPLKGPTTLLTAIALAGGQGRFSEMNEVMLFRTDMTGKRVATKYDVEKIRRGEIGDPVVVNEDLIVVNRSPGRVALRDSFFGDMLDVLNPFRYIPSQ